MKHQNNYKLITFLLKMEFVAFIGKDKENWGQITALIKRLECEKIILVKDKDAEEFPANGQCKIIEFDISKDLVQLKEELKEKLKKELAGDFEVVLSIASGSGKAHMALIAALLNIPVGIRIVAFTKSGIEYLT